MKDPKRKVVCIGLPIYHAVENKFMLSLIDLLFSKPPFDIHVFTIENDSLVARARNKIAAYFLNKTNCTHLLFLDTDLIFKPESIHKLCSHELDVVCGIYCQKRQDVVLPVINSFLDTDKADPESKMLKIKCGGTGIMLIKREVLEGIREQMPELEYRNDTDEVLPPGEGVAKFEDAPPAKRDKAWDFFQTGVVMDEYRRYYSEDWYFCKLSRDCGFSIWADFAVYADHIGTVSFPMRHLIEAAQKVSAQEAKEKIADAYEKVNKDGK